jgi:hypothetical protein
VIEAVAAGHITRVLPGERMQRRTIGTAKADTSSRNREQHESRYECPPPHRAQSSRRGIVAVYSGTSEEVEEAYVRFGSEADICAAKRRVGFALNSDREADSRRTRVRVIWLI